MPDELESVMGQNFIHDFIDQDIAQGGEFEGMTLYTVDGKERTERDFPMPVTDSEAP